MKKKILEALKILLFIGVGIGIIALFWYNLADEHKEKFWESIRKANYGWIFISILLGTLSHASRALRWGMIIEPFGYRPKKSNLFFAVMNMYFFNMAVPRLGEITRCATLQQYEKIPFEKSFGTVVAERAVDVIMLLLTFALAFFLQVDTVLEVIRQIDVPSASAAVHDVSGGGIQEVLGIPARIKIMGWLTAHLKLILAMFVIVGGSVLFLLRKHPFFARIFLKIKTLAKGFWEGLKSIAKLRRPGVFIFHSVFIQCMYFLMTYACFFTLPETSTGNLMAPLTVLVFGSLAIIVVPNGIGLFPVFVAIVLGMKAFGSVDTGTSLALGWIIWGTQTLMILIVGTISMILLPILNRKK